LRPEENAVINEEFSAELSYHSSSKYTDILSKPESEMKISDDGDNKEEADPLPADAVATPNS